MPKGLKNVFEAGIGMTETIMGVPKTMQTVLYVGIACVALVVVVATFTAAWGVGSGKIDVNQLAAAAAEASKNMPAVIPV